MTTRLFSTFEKILAPTVPGCPLPTIVQYVRESAIETCERTYAYRYMQEDIPLSSGVYDYPFETPDNTEVCAVIHATLDNSRITVVPQEELHNRFPAWPDTDDASRSTPQLVSQMDVDNFVVAPVPDAPSATTTYKLGMFLALKPTPDATGMDKTVLDDLERTVVHGALQRLLVMPDKSWTDRQLASYHAKQYVYKVASFRAKSNLGLSRNNIHVRFSAWA